MPDTGEGGTMARMLGRFMRGQGDNIQRRNSFGQARRYAAPKSGGSDRDRPKDLTFADRALSDAERMAVQRKRLERLKRCRP